MHLRGQFARWLENERARHARAGTALFQQRQHGKREGGRLAGPGLGEAQYVLAFKRGRNGLGLDLGGLGEAGCLDGGKDLFAQAKRIK
jgi:hypothetical protein